MELKKLSLIALISYAVLAGGSKITETPARALGSGGNGSPISTTEEQNKFSLIVCKEDQSAPWDGLFSSSNGYKTNDDCKKAGNDLGNSNESCCILTVSLSKTDEELRETYEKCCQPKKEEKPNMVSTQDPQQIIRRALNLALQSNGPTAVNPQAKSQLEKAKLSPDLSKTRIVL